MSRILLLLDHAANRRLLSDALGTRHEVIAPAAAETLAGAFDLCVLDGPALDRLWEKARTRKAAEYPHFLPFLLVTSRQDAGMATRHLWLTVDDLIFSPIEKIELQARVENMLNARRFSAELERRVAERTAALASREEQLRLAVDAADLGTWHWDAGTGALVWSDRCMVMFGLRPGTAMSYERFLDTLHPDDRTCTDQMVQRAWREGTDYRSEFRTVWPDGSVHWIASLGRTYRDSAGNPVRMEGVAQDITERKRAEAERERLHAELRLSEVMAAMGSLIAGFAHEVRNPLFGITATLDAMQARLGDRDEYTEYLTVLRGEASRIGSLVQDLFEYGKPQASEPAPGLVDVVVAEAVRACAPLAEDAGVEIVIHGGSRSPVAMDLDRLRRALENLLRNAVQLSPRGSTVRVDIHDVNDDAACGIECAVRDRGPGFAEEDLPRIFEPFFSRRKGGTGLGLSIVQRVVEAHGGTVSARNRPEGGAEVTVWLPGVRKESPAGTRRRHAKR